MLKMAKGSLAARLISLILFFFLSVLGANVSAGGLSLTFPGGSQTPSQTSYSGDYDYVAFDFDWIDDFTYVLMHYTDSDPYGTEVWVNGTSHVLYDLEPGTHEFGLEYYHSDGSYAGATSYRFEVEILEVENIAPVGGYPETIVGEQPYSINVNGKGDATLDVPLRLIPGVGDFKPSLSIAYNSGDGIARAEQSRPRSILGYGWYVDGVSEIRRCVVGKPASSAIQLNNNDNLCLDGNPLTLVDGSHFSSGSVYRTRIHSDILVEAKTTSGGALWFRVTHPDGTVVKYGVSSSSRVRNGSSPYYQWLPYSATSADGNTISYRYNAADSGTNTIDYISYSGAKIEFFYEENRTDTKSVPIGNTSQTQKSLLRKITVLMNNTKVREYQLLNETVSGKNVLKGIQQCGYDVSGTNRYCLKPIDFNWNTSGAISSVGALLTGVNDSLGADYIISYSDVYSSGASSSFSENPLRVFKNLCQSEASACSPVSSVA